MVTLVGIGGSGKTRLSLEVAARLISGFPGGAWLVELAPLSDPAQLVRAIAEVLSIPGQAERDLLDVVSDAIATRPASLLVLDNCEHIVPACASLVTRLLTRASLLRVLATSRQPLSIPGEAIWPAPPSTSTPTPWCCFATVPAWLAPTSLTSTTTKPWRTSAGTSTVCPWP